LEMRSLQLSICQTVFGEEEQYEVLGLPADSFVQNVLDGRNQ
jgi:hypothetical protein